MVHRNKNTPPLGEAGRRHTPIAYFHSPFTSKFGIPRQSGVVEDVLGQIVFTPEYSNPDAIRGIEDFEYLWLIWEFSANNNSPSKGMAGRESLTVRPPRLGGNERIGVFASRSPFRPNGLGLSCVKLNRIISSPQGGWDGTLEVLGADLMDGTPIYDIKPYIPYTDSHPNAHAGFVDKTEWKPLKVEISDDVTSIFSKIFTSEEQKTIVAALSQDPRPHYHRDPERMYGMPFAGYDIRFTINDGGVNLKEIVKT